ncbi:hypothetical protein [Priestia megaterium]|uniref:hypothetical protein n=1 Tax=Priestia megaterium TaxID=1404 RepID=UPI0030090C45
MKKMMFAMVMSGMLVACSNNAEKATNTSEKHTQTEQEETINEEATSAEMKSQPVVTQEEISSQFESDMYLLNEENNNFVTAFDNMTKLIIGNDISNAKTAATIVTGNAEKIMEHMLTLQDYTNSQQYEDVYDQLFTPYSRMESMKNYTDDFIQSGNKEDYFKVLEQ